MSNKRGLVALGTAFVLATAIWPAAALQNVWVCAAGGGQIYCYVAGTVG